ncbi:MAG: acyltransferase [Peptococcaceae bacterium]|nr:acyltransferase [Peptococcaceae bacterium]
MKGRIVWIDYAKGIGIILVVFGHVIGGINSAGMDISKSFFTGAFSFVYGFHMPLFFFLSGLFVENWLNKENKFHDKISTILWPYFIWSIMQGAVNVLLSGYTNNSLTWSSLFYSILFSPIGQFWYLYVLFIYFILYYCFKKFLSIKIIYLVSLLFFLFNPSLNFWILDKILLNFIFFVSGSLARNKIAKNLFLSINKLPLLIFSLIFIIANFVYLENTDYFNLKIIGKLIIGYIGISFIVVLTIFLQRFKGKFFKSLQFLGKMSMIIYLAHILASSGFRIVAQKLGFENVFGHIIIGSLLGLALPILCYFILERTNLTKFFLGKS